MSVTGGSDSRSWGGGSTVAAFRQTTRTGKQMGSAKPDRSGGGSPGNHSMQGMRRSSITGSASAERAGPLRADAGVGWGTLGFLWSGPMPEPSMISPLLVDPALVGGHSFQSPKNQDYIPIIRPHIFQ